MVLALLMGQSKSVSIQEMQASSGYESEGIKVLVDTGSHIEIGMEQEQKATTQAMAENKAEAQANLKIASEAPPDVYGPNGDNYENKLPYYDYSRIKIDISEQGSGEKCSMGNWITTHWVGNLQNDGRVYTDTKQEGRGDPQIFNLGGHHVIRCLDIALTQLKAGAKAHIECPSFYAYGGALTQSFLKGGLPLPLNADVEYQLEVLNCNEAPVVVPEPPKPKKVGMQGHRQMSLHIAKDLGAQDLVLTCQDDEGLVSPNFKFFPALQCYLEDYVKGDQNQLWVWDPDTFFLMNVATKMYLMDYHKTLMMGHFAAGMVNWDIVKKDYPWYPQWFEFCPYEHVLETEIDGNAMYAAVQPTIKLRNDVKIMGFTEKDTQEVLDRGIFRVQYEFKNW